MKKVTSAIISLMLLGVLLSGCYNKGCGEPQPMQGNYKGM